MRKEDENAVFDPNDWQGRSEKQVTSSLKGCFWTFCVFAVLIIGYTIIMLLMWLEVLN
jgi:hypothetical protein